MDILMTYMLDVVGMDAFVASWVCGIIIILIYYFVLKMILYIFSPR